MTRSLHTLLARLLLVTACLSGQNAFAATLDITDAWIRYLPTVVPVRSGYMTIENRSNVAVKITGVESEVFTQVEIHESITKDGMMLMRPAPSLIVPDGETLQLKPGGLHLMMMKPDRQLNPGEEVNITLYFDNNESQTVIMTVKK